VEHRSTARTGGEHAADAGRRPLLLVAEDSAVGQRVAALTLEYLGYRVDLAANGLEAVHAVAGVAYEAVLMDCEMPEMDGFEATEVIRAREGAGAHLPIIAMTASTDPDDRARCLAAGMDDVVAKPVHRAVLQEVLGR